MLYSIEKIASGLVSLVADDGNVLTVDCGAFPDAPELGGMYRMENGIFVADHGETDKRKALFHSLLNQILSQPEEP